MSAKHITKIPKQAVIIGGCMRSGKTTLLQLLVGGLARLPNKKILLVNDAMEPFLHTVSELSGISWHTLYEIVDEVSFKGCPDLNPSDYTDIIFAVDGILQGRDTIALYQKPQSSIIKLLNDLIEEPTYIPFVYITAHPDNEIEHPATPS